MMVPLLSSIAGSALYLAPSSADYSCFARPSDSVQQVVRQTFEPRKTGSSPGYPDRVVRSMPTCTGRYRFNSWLVAKMTPETKANRLSKLS
jgi:hypothetical protein